jgi:hypothetical protein
MFIGILQWIIISLILIALAHHIYYFLKDTLTVPKIKDLVNKPTEQYSEIKSILDTEDKQNNSLNKNKSSPPSSTETTTLQNPQIQNTKMNTLEMKNELKNFFTELNTPSMQTSSIPSYSTQNFSQY